MTVRELIRDLLREAGKDKRADQLFAELEDNDFGNTQIGADVDSGPIRYVESISNEGPCFVGLKCERVSHGW